jgi:hypothetical protein
LWIPGSGVQRRGVDDVRLADLTGPLADQAGFDTVLLLCGNLGVALGGAEEVDGRPRMSWHSTEEPRCIR